MWNLDLEHINSLGQLRILGTISLNWFLKFVFVTERPVSRTQSQTLFLVQLHALSANFLVVLTTLVSKLTDRYVD